MMQPNNGITKLVATEEALRCLLCHDAPCSKACPAHSNPGDFIKSLRFENELGAYQHLTLNNVLPETCATLCNGNKYCERACLRNKIDSPIRAQPLNIQPHTLHN